MLTDAQRAVINQTVPLLLEKGEALARHMYLRMFELSPEVKPYFNPAHQVSGRQQKALACAICAYAKHIDNPGALLEDIELISQKHVSLGILPEHYPIVGSHLLASIRDVLGEAADDAVMEAWAAAYGQLAEIFIGRENELYDNKREYHGWSDKKPFRVTHVEPVSDNVMSVYLRPTDGAPLPPHAPGQYVAIEATVPGGRTELRNYSLSNAPGTDYYRISVKREDAPSADVPFGQFSYFVHDQLQRETVVQVSPPCGEFVLEPVADAARPLVFLAGGIGITPLLSMLHAALADSANAERPIIFVQAVRNERVRPFAEELAVLEEAHANLRLHIRYSEPEPGDLSATRDTGFVDDALLDALVSGQDADYYFCGPNPMLLGVHQLLMRRAVPDSAIHFEFFGPADALQAAA